MTEAAHNLRNVTPFSYVAHQPVGEETAPGVHDISAVSDGEASGLTTIEQVNALLCSMPRRPYLLGVNRGAQKAVLFQPRCKSWSCPACADTNKRLWAVKVYHGAEVIAENGNPINFLTITSHGKLDAAATIKVFPHAWGLLRQRAYRATGGFDYVLIPERHQDGRLHVHALETAGLGRRWWKDNAAAVGLGYMADESIAKSAAGAAYYAVKYLTKSIECESWPRGFRRVRTSRRWPELPDMPEVPGWDWRKLENGEGLVTTIERLRDSGLSVEVLDHRAAWEYAKENAPE